MMLAIFPCACGLPDPTGMRAPEPVVVDRPQMIKADIPDSAIVIGISEKEIVLRRNKTSDTLISWRQLDDSLQMISQQKPCPRLALSAEGLTDIKRLDTALALFKKNNIVQFNLVTDQEK